MSEDGSPRSDPHSSVPAALLPWQKKPRFSWTPAYETTFFQSLCQSVQLGLRENMSFKPEGWNRALAVLREQGAYPTKSHLINKTDNARKKFRLWRGLLENPQFTFDPTTRMIKGSEEAWAAHLEKEPLARALRDRPFDNAEYLEILFPDVVGSGGLPKRIMKVKRKGPDIVGEPPPGTGILRLANGSSVAGGNASATPTPMRNNAGITSTIGSMAVSVPSNNTPQSRQPPNPAVTQSNPGMQVRPSFQGNIQQGPIHTSSIQPPLPPSQAPSGLRQLNGIARAGSSLALTPPDERIGAINNTNAPAGPGQKRFASGMGGATQPTASKRRRTDGSINTGNANRSRAGTQANNANATANSAVAASTAATASAAATASKNAGINSQAPAGSQLSSSGDGTTAPAGRQQPSGASATSGSAGVPRADGITNLLGDVLNRYASAASLASTTRWPEQAMEIFFLEFADEDMDLQLRIAEKILTDTSKAVMFCKMPSMLRKHWVKRLREAISRQGN